jgi:hypothetical protein
MIARDIEPMMADEARKRIEAAQVKPGEVLRMAVDNRRQPLDQPEEPDPSWREERAGRSSEQAGAAVGVSGRAVLRAKKVAREDPVLAEEVRG